MKLISKKILWPLLFLVFTSLILILRIYKVVSFSNVSSIAPENKPTILPENIFDTKVQIPGTAIYISYPKDGFYGLGIKTVMQTKDGGNKEFPIGLMISKADYDPKKNSAGVTLAARGLHHFQKGETLQSFLHSYFLRVIKEKQLYIEHVTRSGGRVQDEDPTPESCKYVAISGQDFCITKWNNGLTYQEAFTVINGDLIYVSIDYTFMPTDDLILRAQSTAAYENNDKLFLDILSHLEFK